MMTLEHLNSPFAFFKHEDHFLKLSEVETYFHITNKFIYDRVNDVKIKFSIDDFKLLLKDDFNVRLLFYEVGAILDYTSIEVVSDEIDLATFINFKNVDKYNSIQEAEAPAITNIEKINFEEYENIFDRTRKHLLAGDCYQLNLTSRLSFEVSSTLNLINSFLSSNNLSEFAHLLNLPFESRLVVSNSPECLYEISNKTLTSRPIKGTIKDSQDESFFLTDKKNEAELNIITDLIRNDLSRIGSHFSIVDKRRAFLNVPGLIHQYSQVSVKLENPDLEAILRGIFPGGSITGAPKKNVMRLINGIESSRRGVYTGSTILKLPNINKASINIRTMDLNTQSRVAKYGSGGGITLLSDAAGEYSELLDKTNSFLKVFFKDVNF